MARFNVSEPRETTELTTSGTFKEFLVFTVSVEGAGSRTVKLPTPLPPLDERRALFEEAARELVETQEISGEV